MKTSKGMKRVAGRTQVNVAVSPQGEENKEIKTSAQEPKVSVCNEGELHTSSPPLTPLPLFPI